MRKILLCLGLCIFALIAGAQTIVSLTSNSWGDEGSKQYNIQGMHKVSAGEWKTNDVISVELVGVTETAVSGLGFTLVDNSSAANYWLPLSETISLGESLDANGEISYKGEVSLIADVVTSSSVQIVFGTASSNEEITENGTLTFSTFKVEKPGDVVNPHDNLSLADLSAGWNSSYDATTSTITFDAGWVGRGWWLGGTDLSEYSSVTVEFEAAPFEGKLVVQRADESMMEATFSAGATSVKCMLTDDISNINQIYIQNSAAGDLVLTAAYYTKKGFEEGGEEGGEQGGNEGGPDPIEPAFTFEVPTTTFEAEYKDDEISGYTAKIELGVNDLMLKKDDVVSLVFNGSFNADVLGISPAVIDQWEGKGYWYELSGWDWTQFDSKANQKINITANVTLTTDAETTAILVCIPVQGGNGETEIVFTSVKTPIEEIDSNSFSIENGVVYSAGEITVYNIVGKPVATASQVFDVNSLQAGVYFIVAQEGTIKFVK